VGCEFFATVTRNSVPETFHFAVTLSNTSADPAMVSIEGGALSAPMQLTVAPASVSTQVLPWVAALKAGTALARRAAYRIRSTRPLAAYQFNPLEYRLPSQEISTTNDASLLLPVGTLTGHYFVAAWPADPIAGLVAVTATTDGTHVTIAPLADTPSAGGAPAFASGVPGTVALDRGDVLQIMSPTGDLTGSEVTADQPIQVIGGHECANVPVAVPACDHLEETIFPVETLGDRYLVVAPAVPMLPDGKVEVIRIVGTVDGTTLSYDPPQPQLPTRVAKSQLVETPPISQDFEIRATHRILVAQYMTGQGAGGGAGDPSLSLAVATQQLRSSYLFHAPPEYQTSYVNVVAPQGAQVLLDDMQISGFTGIGATGYGARRVQLGASTTGDHHISADKPFGITVYGYGSYSSYWYPGGLDLRPLQVD
jgi:hypothetical protein